MKSISIVILALVCLLLTSALLEWNFIAKHWVRQAVIILFMVFQLWFFWTMLMAANKNE